MTHSLPLNSKPHYPILDGLRGVAAIVVVIFHLFEPHSTSHLDLIINHGYLAVDFFFLLSGFVIGYAYDDRWGRLTLGGFCKRRLIRLQPMVVIGMIVGAVCFYFQDSPAWPSIHTVSAWKLLLVMFIGFTIIPIPTSMDIRGWEEMHPLDGPGWTLFFEYIANFLYATIVRKFSKTALTILVALAAVVLIHYAVTSKTGDVIGGWSLNAEQLQIGFIRVAYPFFAGLLLFRAARLRKTGNAFFWSSVLLVTVLAIPRVGGSHHLWMNGLYDSLIIVFIFPLIVYLGAGGVLSDRVASRICRFLGDISYPVYITHYPLVYLYTAYVSAHPGIKIIQALPFMLTAFTGALVLAYACLKLYDEPVRNWLSKKTAG